MTAEIESNNNLLPKKRFGGKKTFKLMTRKRFDMLHGSGIVFTSSVLQCAHFTDWHILSTTWLNCSG